MRTVRRCSLFYGKRSKIQGLASIDPGGVFEYYVINKINESKAMKKTEILLMVLQVPVDLFMLLLAGLSAYYARFSDWALALRPVMFELDLSEFMGIVFWMATVWLLIFAMVGLYSPNPNRRFSNILNRIFVACSTGLAFLAMYLMFSQQLFDSRFLVAAAWFFALVYVVLGRLLMRGLKGILYRLSIGLRTIVIVGDQRFAETIASTFRERPEFGYRVLGIFPCYDSILVKKLDGMEIDEFLFANPRAHEEEAIQALDYCNERHITFKYSADLFSTYTSNMSVHPVGGIPIVELKRVRLDGWGSVIKTVFDTLLSLVALIALGPLMILVLLAVYAETGSPVIYKNERVGLRGKHFFTFKFRSMYQDECTGAQFGSSGKKAEEREQELIRKQGTKEGPIYKIGDDPRVTKVGAFIRRWSLDELPQFYNVLKGEMSLVGPRPHQPREVEAYEKHHKSIFSIKPGITGLSQISGRSDLSFEEEMKLDILYMERWSLFLDMIIFLKTPFILFKKRRAL